MKKFIVLVLTACVAFALETGSVPAEVTIDGQNGGKVDGTPWSSSMLKGKVHVLLYVDPDEQGDLKQFTQALHKKAYDREKYGLVAIINLKATWLPNFAIEKKLASKQKEFPYSTYVQDKTKYLVKKWNLADDSANVVILDKDSKVLYTHYGKMDSDEMQKAFKLIETNL